MLHTLLIHLLLYGDRRLTQELPHLPTDLLGENGNTCIPSLVIYRCFISAHSCDHIYRYLTGVLGMTNTMLTPYCNCINF